MPRRKFEVPGPAKNEPEASTALAVKEVVAFDTDDSSMWQGKWPRYFFHGGRIALIVFALVINWWWDLNVRALLWQSGRAGSGFHLNDSVLIALVTTSVANFLALVGIIARDLFSGRRK